MRARVREARVARLATAGPDGRPHLVPITFALVDDVLYTAIDHKPKTTTALTRLANIARDPRVSVLVDRYSDEWSQLWWVRMDGAARVVEEAVERAWGVDALRSKYEPYGDRPPDGTVIAIRIERWRGWAAARSRRGLEGPPNAD